MILSVRASAAKGLFRSGARMASITILDPANLIGEFDTPGGFVQIFLSDYADTTKIQAIPPGADVAVEANWVDVEIEWDSSGILRFASSRDWHYRIIADAIGGKAYMSLEV